MYPPSVVGSISKVTYHPLHKNICHYLKTKCQKKKRFLIFSRVSNMASCNFISSTEFQKRLFEVGQLISTLPNVPSPAEFMRSRLLHLRLMMSPLPQLRIMRALHLGKSQINSWKLPLFIVRRKKKVPYLPLNVLSFLPSMQFYIIKGKDLLVSLKSVLFCFLFFPKTSEIDKAK